MSNTGITAVTDTRILKAVIGELIKANELKALRRLLKINSNCNKLSAKELNKEFPLEKHKFVTRNDKIEFIRAEVKKSVNEKCIDICNECLAKIDFETIFPAND